MHPAPVRISDLVEKDISAKLHVLTLTPFYPSDGDDVSGCFVAETLRALKSSGVASSVIAVDTIYHPLRKPSQQDPAQWIRYPQLPGNFGLSSAGSFLGATILTKVRQFHRLSPIDVIHAHAPLPCGHAAAFLSKRLGIPFVVTIHGLDVFNACFQQGVAANWRRRAAVSVYKSARRVICISEKVRRLLTAGIGEGVSTKVVYNGTDPTLFVPGTACDETPNILIVGNLLAGKGQELVMQAFARVKQTYTGLQIRMIGDGADRNRFEALAQHLGIRDQVHFLGRRSRMEVAEAMRNCTVFALPSRYEGLGCVYLEAMACGKPVIACRDQGIEEIIRHGSNGWLIPVDGIEELVQGLQVLLGDTALRGRIGQAARQTILDSLTMSRQAEMLATVYEEVVR